MKRLAEHNDDKRKTNNFVERVVLRAGVVCDRCDAEMSYKDSSSLLSRNRGVRCPSCGLTGTKYS